MQIHLDLMGGLAGDMFIAGLLDAFPEHEASVVATLEMLVEAAGSSEATPPARAGDPPCRLVPHHDGVLSGRRFEVGGDPRADKAYVGPERRHAGTLGGTGHAHAPTHTHNRHRHGDDADHDHDLAAAARPANAELHVDWSAIRAQLRHALPPAIERHARGIFTLLAEAEAAVHGVAVDQVAFHEVGAWDSIADIAGAACLIDAIGATRWTASAVPLGSGRVRTAHGPMPVPTPATALLLRGFEVVDDGVAGERVTPTGAAILKYLVPPATHAAQSAPFATLLARSGVGFGSRRLPGISNCVRVLGFDAAHRGRTPDAAGGQHRRLAVVEFEVDDQSAEELAMGLDRLRRHEAVFDVLQAPVFGKKGRMMTAIRLLARPSALDQVTEACFRETTTIGLRHMLVDAAALPRQVAEVAVDGRTVRVKTVERPGGATAKAESDDALAPESHHARQRLRRDAERQVLDMLSRSDHV